MTINAKAVLLLMMAAVISLQACKKDDRTRTELLTSTSCWSLTKREVYNASTTQWVENALQNCEKDDCYAFTVDGTYTKNEGTTKCTPAQTTSGTWTFNDDETLTRTEGSAFFTFTIKELTDERMVWEGEVLGFETRFTWEAK
jgi:hypothetical protein